MRRSVGVFLFGFFLAGFLSVSFSAEGPGTPDGPGGEAIYGGNLMTMEEREEFRERLRELDTDEARESFLQEHGRKIRERSEFFGVAPETGNQGYLPSLRERRAPAVPPQGTSDIDTGEVAPIPDDPEPPLPGDEPAPEFGSDLPDPELQEKGEQIPLMESDPDAGLRNSPEIPRPEEERRFRPGFGPARERKIPLNPEVPSETGPPAGSETAVPPQENLDASEQGGAAERPMPEMNENVR